MTMTDILFICLWLYIRISALDKKLVVAFLVLCPDKSFSFTNRLFWHYRLLTPKFIFFRRFTYVLCGIRRTYQYQVKYQQRKDVILSFQLVSNFCKINCCILFYTKKSLKSNKYSLKLHRLHDYNISNGYQNVLPQKR